MFEIERKTEHFFLQICRSIVWSGEILGIHKVLQTCWQIDGGAPSQGAFIEIQDDRRLPCARTANKWNASRRWQFASIARQTSSSQHIGERWCGCCTNFDQPKWCHNWTKRCKLQSKKVLIPHSPASNQYFRSITFFVSRFFSRCDSFGNRPVTAPSSQYRKNASGHGGRVRSGSTGNRPQVANSSNRPWSNQSRHHNSASNSSANNDTHSQQSSQSQPSSRSQTITRPNNSSFTIREPPHQQQSQQHNFAAPRKGIFNLNNHSTANANTKDLNTKLVQTNNKEHNKENLVEIKKTGSTENANDNNKTTASTSSSTVAASPATNAAATGVAVTAGNGAASKKN